MMQMKLGYKPTKFAVEVRMGWYKLGQSGFKL